MRARCNSRNVALGVVCAILVSATGAHAEGSRSFHVTFCQHNTDEYWDTHLFSENTESNSSPDGRMVAEGDGDPVDVWCPIIEDSLISHIDVQRILVHGYDASEEFEVIARACVVPVTGSAYISCGADAFTADLDGDSSSDPSYVGDFSLLVDVSGIDDLASDFALGFAFLSIDLPRDYDSGTRVTGYEICDNLLDEGCREIPSL